MRRRMRRLKCKKEKENPLVFFVAFFVMVAFFVVFCCFFVAFCFFFLVFCFFLLFFTFLIVVLSMGNNLRMYLRFF